MTLLGTTGATGRLGGKVAQRLADTGVRQRLIVRDPSRAPRLDGAEVAQATYGDGEAVRRALEGVDVALMVSAAESSRRVEEHASFIDAAVRAGVAHLVYVSFLGAGQDATFTHAREHWATEQLISASGLEFTFLRDSLYADFVPLMVGADGVIRGPAGDGRAGIVAIDDIADVAAEVLRDPSSHRDVAYDLTGPEALTMTEMAAIISATTGRQVRFEDETLDQAYASRESYGAPRWEVDAWVSSYTAIAAGEMAEVSRAVEDITGHVATPFAALLHR